MIFPDKITYNKLKRLNVVVNTSWWVSVLKSRAYATIFGESGGDGAHVIHPSRRRLPPLLQPPFAPHSANHPDRSEVLHHMFSHRRLMFVFAPWLNVNLWLGLEPTNILDATAKYWLRTTGWKFNAHLITGRNSAHLELVLSFSIDCRYCKFEIKKENAWNIQQVRKHINSQ